MTFLTEGYAETVFRQRNHEWKLSYHQSEDNHARGLYTRMVTFYV